MMPKLKNVIETSWYAFFCLFGRKKYFKMVNDHHFPSRSVFEEVQMISIPEKQERKAGISTTYH